MIHLVSVFINLKFCGLSQAPASPDVIVTDSDASDHAQEPVTSVKGRKTRGK